MRPRFLLPLLIAFVVAPAFAQTDDASTADAVPIGTSTIMPDDAAALAVRSSTALVSLRRNLADAMDEFGWESYRDDLGVSLTGAVSGSSFDAITSTAGVSVGFDIDLIPQLTLSTELGATILDPVPANGYDIADGSLGLSFAPLADASDRDRDELAVESAQFAITQETRARSYSAIVRLFAAVREAAEIQGLENALSLAERNLASVTALRDRDRATDDQVESATDVVRFADQDLRRGEFDLIIALNSLSSELGIPVSEEQLPALEMLDLETTIANAMSAIVDLDEDELVSQSPGVVEAGFGVTAERIARSEVRAFDPSALVIDANVGSALTLPSEGASVEFAEPEVSISFLFSVNASNWDRDRVSRADEDITLAEQSLEAAVAGARLSLRSQRLDLTIALENVAAAERDLLLAEQDLLEAEFLRGRGELTDLAYDQTNAEVDAAALTAQFARLTAVQQLYAIELIQF